MKLELDRLDLIPSARDTPCSKVSYRHLTGRAQRAVQAVGKAVFYEFDHMNYNRVYPPKQEAEG